MKIQIDNGKRRARPQWRICVDTNALTSASIPNEDITQATIHATFRLTRPDEHSRCESVSISLTPEEARYLVRVLTNHLAWIESGEPCCPEEDDWTTHDHKNFYQAGKIVLTLTGEETDAEMWDAIANKMESANFSPNVWFISDHGNAHLMRDRR